MKKVLYLTLLVLLLFVSTACSGSSNDTSSTDSQTDLAGEETGTDTRPVLTEGELPVAIQLQLGTFELEGTEVAIDAEQATAFLPLWKAYRSLSTSDTAAAVEIEAVVNQIQGEMTPEQLEYIATFEFSQENMFVLMEELGLSPRGPGEGDEFPEGFTPGEGFRGGGFPEGGIPGGGPGGEGGPGGFGGQLDPEQQATMEALRESRGGANNRFASFLIDPLIEYLEGIAAGDT
jgi:hypothetical protein